MSSTEKFRTKNAECGSETTRFHKINSPKAFCPRGTGTDEHRSQKPELTVTPNHTNEGKRQNAERLSPLYQEGMSRRDRGVSISNTECGMRDAEVRSEKGNVISGKYQHAVVILNAAIATRNPEPVTRNSFTTKGTNNRRKLRVGDSTAIAWGIKKKNSDVKPQKALNSLKILYYLSLSVFSVVKNFCSAFSTNPAVDFRYEISFTLRGEKCDMI